MESKIKDINQFIYKTEMESKIYKTNKVIRG